MAASQKKYVETVMTTISVGSSTKTGRTRLVAETVPFQSSAVGEFLARFLPSLCCRPPQAGSDRVLDFGDRETAARQVSLGMGSKPDGLHGVSRQIAPASPNRPISADPHIGVPVSIARVVRVVVAFPRF